MVIKTFEGNEVGQGNDIGSPNRKAHTELGVGRISKVLNQERTTLQQESAVWVVVLSVLRNH